MLVEKRRLVLSGPWSRQVHPWSSLVYSQTSSCSVTNRIYDNPCTVEKRHPIFLGPEQVQLQTSSCSVTNRIFFITLAPPQVHFGLAATCSSVRAPLAFAGSVGRSIQQATAAESSAGAVGLLYCGAAAASQPSNNGGDRSAVLYRIHLMYVGNPSKFSWFERWSAGLAFPAHGSLDQSGAPNLDHRRKG